MLVGKVSRIFVKPEPSSIIKHYFNAVLKLYTSSGHSNVLRKCLKKNSSWKRELLIKVEDTFSFRPCAVNFFIGFSWVVKEPEPSLTNVNIGFLKHTNPKTNRRYPISASFKGVKARYSIGILFERNNGAEWPLKLLLPVTEYKRVALFLPESYLAASALGHVKQTFHHVKQTSGRKLHNNNIGVMGLLRSEQVASLSTITMQWWNICLPALLVS